MTIAHLYRIKFLKNAKWQVIQDEIRHNLIKANEQWSFICWIHMCVIYVTDCDPQWRIQKLSVEQIGSVGGADSPKAEHFCITGRQFCLQLRMHEWLNTQNSHSDYYGRQLGNGSPDPPLKPHLMARDPTNFGDPCCSWPINLFIYDPFTHCQLWTEYA